jgi:two-component system sensor histidine kinase PhoQ
MQRGVRLDESAPGHGIGLAVVRDIVASYNGAITIDRSALGGAEVSVSITPDSRAAASRGQVGD